MKPPFRFFTWSALAGLAFVGTSCTHMMYSGGGSNPPAASVLCQLKDDNGHAIPANFAGTLGTIHRAHAANHVNQILTVKSACCANYDRLVFAVDGIHQPTYTVQYANPPFSDCGSGNTHQVPGAAHLTVRMKPAEAHGNGQPTLPREASYQCSNLKHLSVTCDFESDLTFVIGLNSKQPYRVIELQNPTRLVIDVKH